MVKDSAAKIQKTNDNRRSDEVKYKGVRKRKWGKWVSEIRLPNSRERIWLGSYDSAEKAARAFDAAMFCLRGSNAKFNFPDNPPEIPNGRSLSRDQIQEAAAKFANSERKSDSRVQSPCPSETVSDGTVQSDHFMLDASFLDTLANTNMLDPDGFGYSEFDDFFRTISGIPYGNFEEENMDYVFNQDSFLWNF